MINKLFVYTDEQEWKKLQNEVFTNEVVLDMSSMGGVAKKTTSKAITEMWKEGFKGLDAVTHMGGNYIIDIKDNLAEILAYSTATHYRKAARKGQTREFVGTYNIRAVKVDDYWKIDGLKYNLKYITGNIELE